MQDFCFHAFDGISRDIFCKCGPINGLCSSPVKHQRFVSSTLFMAVTRTVRPIQRCVSQAGDTSEDNDALPGLIQAFTMIASILLTIGTKLVEVPLGIYGDVHK